MRHHAVLLMTMVGVGAVSACSDDDGGGTQTTAGRGGTGGAVGAAGAAGTGGAGGTGGVAGAAGTGGSGTTVPVPPVPPTPALPADAATITCPTAIDGSLDVADRSQTGRHSRIDPSAACGMPKGSPGTAADPSNPHLFDVYRFLNPTAAPVCFDFTLTYGAIGVIDGGLDAGPDAAVPEDESDLDASAADAAVNGPVVNAGPLKYLTAYSTFFPTDITLQYLGDVGAVLTSPQVMGITVPAGGTIDVVVYAIDIGAAGVGSYTLSCSTQ
jgi:hypothetical protein